MKQPVLITTPYDFDRILKNSYTRIFDMVDDNDWVCFMDGDIAFLEMADFGHMLMEYIKKYPDTGLFTCYASRCHYRIQRDANTNDESDSIKYLAERSLEISKKYHLQVEDISIPIAGHLIMMKKAVWNDIQPILRVKARKKAVLGFDTQLCKSVLEKGYKIRLMKGIMVFHYLRFLTGKNTKLV